MFGLDSRDAPDGRNLIMNHAIAGPHRQLKRDVGVRVGDNLTIKREVVRRGGRQAGREKNRTASKRQVAGRGAKDGDSLRGGGHSNPQAGLVQDDRSASGHVSVAGLHDILVSVASERKDVTGNDGASANGSERQRGGSDCVTRAVRGRAGSRALRGRLNLGRLTEAEAVEVAEQSLTKQRATVASLVDLEEVRRVAKRNASRGIKHGVAVGHRRTVIVKNLFDVGPVRENRSGASGGAIRTARAVLRSNRDVDFHLVHTGTNRLCNLLLLNREEAWATVHVQVADLFLLPAKRKRAALGERVRRVGDHLIRGGRESHRGRDVFSSRVHRSRRNADGLVESNAVSVGVKLNGGDQASEFPADHVKSAVGVGNEIGDCVCHDSLVLGFLG